MDFVALSLASTPDVALRGIRIELRRGATTVSITWPGQASGECGCVVTAVAALNRIAAMWPPATA